MLHAGHADHAMARGWATLVDKPFVMKTADARRLVAAATQRKLLNAVAFNRRLDAGCRRAREIIRSGGIGAVRYVQTVQLGYEKAGWFLDPALGGGGAYTGRGTHMADIVPWLIDSRPTQVRSRLRPGPTGRADLGGFIEIAFPGIECQLACIEEGWHMWDEIRIFGEDGMIELRRPLAMPTGWTMGWHSKRGAAREELAAGFGFRAWDDSIAISAQVLTENRDQALDLLRLALSEPIAAVPYRSSREGGRMILIDEATNVTAGALLLSESVPAR
jgi:predicted dehydrogenase